VIEKQAARSDTAKSDASSGPIATRPACLIALAFILIASQVIIAKASPYITHVEVHQWRPALVLMTLLIVPCAILFAALPALTRLPPTRLLIAAMLATGIAMRVGHMGAVAIAETDHFRYLWDGAVLANGHNPYAIAPADAANTPHLATLARIGSATLTGINFPEYRTIYPGVAQALFALAHSLKPWSLDGLRILLLALDITTVAFLITLLRTFGLSPLWAAAYWLNPLVVLVAANQAHIDAALPPFILGALIAINAKRPATAAISLALAVGIKVWPLLLVPLFIRQLWPDTRKVATLLIAGAIATLAVMGPLLYSTLASGSGLTAYAGGWAMNNPFYLWLVWGLWATLPAAIPSDQMLRGILALTTCALAIAQTRAPIADLRDLTTRALICTAALFYLSPTEFPWYALWFLPLAAALACRPLLLAPVLLPTYFAFFPMAESGIRQWYHYGLSFAHGLPILVWLVWTHSRLRIA
jgi:alpha-1,6-mannosyltransferase